MAARAYSRLAAPPIDQIDDGYVLQSFRSPTLNAVGVPIMPHNGKIGVDTHLTHEQLASIGPMHLRCLIENRFIGVNLRRREAPAVIDGGSQVKPAMSADSATPGPHRFAVQVGFGRWSVFEGAIIGDRITRSEAEALIGMPAKAKEKAAKGPKRKRGRPRTNPVPTPPQPPQTVLEPSHPDPSPEVSTSDVAQNQANPEIE